MTTRNDGSCEIEIRAGSAPPGASEPITIGCPFAPGALRDPLHVTLQTTGGTSVPVQCEALERWPDGSVGWALLDFQVVHPAPARLRVGVAAGGSGVANPSPGVSIREIPDGWLMDTGAAQFVVQNDGPFPFRSAIVAGRETLDPAASGLFGIDAAGRRFTAEVRRTELERSGPLRATILVEGAFRGDGAPPLVFFARIHAFAGLAAATIALTVRNPRRAARPGGIWELGDARSALFRDLSLVWTMPGAARAAWSAETDQPLVPADGDVEIYQESSGGENWTSRVHRTRDGHVPMTFRGYRARAGGETRSGLRATPRVVVHDGGSGVSVCIRDFWQNFPKALAATASGARVGLFPGSFPAVHELQGGEQKTHEIAIVLGADALGDRAEVFRVPSLAAPAPAAFADSGAVPYLVPLADGPDPGHTRAIAAALDPADGFVAKRERFDEYGWRHFGEIPADHEARGWQGEGTFVSHYNNQYDAVYGAFTQFARSGDPRWFRLFDELARHVADIDVYHTTEDRPWYNGGLFWPTVHYTDAGLSTHRTYPRGTSGGGPDNEHNYTTGLRAWWLLTGNPLGREASLDGARRTLAADDGRSTRLRWLDGGPTGFSSKTRSFDYHGPGRGAANSIVALLDAWALTGEEKWLAACDDLVRRTIHPKDDVASRDLLDAENRWSYTVHLQAIGRYLDDRAQAGRIDAMYAYARESLLAYARWMAEHERPTLDLREKLEFPTETWAAQDLRKADVFCFAALHAPAHERARFRERARYFRDRSLATLEEFPTRTFARPLVLVSRFGGMLDWLERHGEEARPVPESPPAEFGKPVPFLPQRARAIRRARDVVITAAAAGAGFALARIVG